MKIINKKAINSIFQSYISKILKLIKIFSKSNTSESLLSKEFKNVSAKTYEDYKKLNFSNVKLFFQKIYRVLFLKGKRRQNFYENKKKDLLSQIQQPVQWGFTAIIITIVLFGAWSIIAPLDSASIIEGHVVLSGHRKQILHLDGGVVEKILIKDGDVVKKGQSLILLDKTRHKLELNKILWHLRRITFIDYVLQQKNKILQYNYYKKYFNGQKVINEHYSSNYSRNDHLNILILNNLKTALYKKHDLPLYNDYIKSNINIINIQIQNSLARIKRIDEKMFFEIQNIIASKSEYKIKKALYHNFMEKRENVMQAQTELRQYKSQFLDDKMNRLFEELKITEFLAKKKIFFHEQSNKINEELRKNLIELISLESQYMQIKDMYEKADIVSPNSGIITGLNVHTTGSPIPPSDKPVVEIIPQDDNLVIEAFIPVNEIDSVNIGSAVKIQLNAYKTRLIPRIKGNVVYISADKFDSNTLRSGYYKIKIEFIPEELTNLNSDINLYPGMSATLFLVKGTRTFAEYLYSPIRDSFYKALKEQ